MNSLILDLLIPSHQINSKGFSIRDILLLSAFFYSHQNEYNNKRNLNVFQLYFHLLGIPKS